MANEKPFAFTEMTNPATLADDDWVYGIDRSDPTDDATNGSDFKMLVSNFVDAIGRRGMVWTTAAQSNSTTTLGDAVNSQGPSGVFGWTIAASATYAFEYVVFALSGATTSGHVLSMNGPAIGAGVLRYEATSPIASATTIFSGGASAYDTKIIPTGIISTTVPTMLWLNGYLKNGATGGTLKLQFCSEVAASTTMLEGSWGRLTRLA